MTQTKEERINGSVSMLAVVVFEEKRKTGITFPMSEKLPKPFGVGIAWLTRRTAVEKEDMLFVRI